MSPNFNPSIPSSTPSGFGYPNVFSTPFGTQCTSGPNSSTFAAGTSMQATPSLLLIGGSSSGATFGQTSNPDINYLLGPGFASPFAPYHNYEQPSNFLGESAVPFQVPAFGRGAVSPFPSSFSVPTFGTEAASPFPYYGPNATSSASTDRSKTDASAGEESKHQQKLQCDEMEKSVHFICQDVIRHQEDMKSWIERYRSLELEKIEDTQTINQLRNELAQVRWSRDAIIAEYLESPAFTKRLDEEHEKRLSEIFHPSYVKALHTVQNKLPKVDPWKM